MKHQNKIGLMAVGIVVGGLVGLVGVVTVIAGARAVVGSGSSPAVASVKPSDDMTVREFVESLKSKGIITKKEQAEYIVFFSTPCALIKSGDDYLFQIMQYKTPKEAREMIVEREGELSVAIGRFSISGKKENMGRFKGV